MALKINSFYEREVLNRNLPHFNISKDRTRCSSIYMADDFETDKVLNLNPHFANKNLYKSKYYFDRSDLFVHYTSLEAAYNIATTGKLRLYSLEDMKDPNEINFMMDTLQRTNLDTMPLVNGFDADFSAIDNLKSEVFVFCCNAISNEDSFEESYMWDNYGMNNIGVAIIFKIDSSLRYEWYNFHLSKVYYGEGEELKEMKQLFDKHHRFLVENKINRQYNYNNFFATFLATHKNEGFRNENEIRLITKLSNIYVSGEGSWEAEFRSLFPQLSGPSRDSSGNIIYKKFIELNLLNRYDYRGLSQINHKEIPLISIHKIVLGNKCSEKDLGCFNQNLQMNMVGESNIEVEMSRLT